MLPVDILILGAGWTSTFLIPLCIARSISYAATTRSAERGSGIVFVFDPDFGESGGSGEKGDEGKGGENERGEGSGDNTEEDKESKDREERELEKYKILPDAHTVLITFPIEKRGAVERLVWFYRRSRRQAVSVGESVLVTRFILLGSTGIWNYESDNNTVQTQQNPPPKWITRHSPLPTKTAPAYPHPRAVVESELLALNSAETPTTVLNLAGLWGGAGSEGSPTRDPRNWVGRVVKSKEGLKGKGSLHLLHGHDLARAIVAVHAHFDRAAGQRWLLTDGRVYDWWDLVSAWGGPLLEDRHQDEEEQDEEEAARGPYARWVRELMEEQGVHALPRGVELLGGRALLDSREFWAVFGIVPVRGRVEGGRVVGP